MTEATGFKRPSHGAYNRRTEDADGQPTQRESSPTDAAQEPFPGPPETKRIPKKFEGARPRADRCEDLVTCADGGSGSEAKAPAHVEQ